VQALVETWRIAGTIIDPCAPNGSGIADELIRLGQDARCADSPTGPITCGWLVTNPPYDLRFVDEIAWQMLRSVESASALGMAMLMRANWDFAARRADLFSHGLDRGQTRMRFRPWWSGDRKAQPIHNYVWHIWSPGAGEPVIRYWPRPALSA
jgi:hypothetical protein